MKRPAVKPKAQRRSDQRTRRPAGHQHSLVASQGDDAVPGEDVVAPEHEPQSKKPPLRPNPVKTLAADGEALAASPVCECGHAATQHIGDDNDGPCSYEDGRGTCSCSAFAVASAAAATLAAITAAGVVDEIGSALVTTYDLTRGTFAERRFWAAAIEAGYQETRRAHWPCEAELGEHGETLHRGDDANEGVFRLDDGSIVYAAIDHGWCSVRAASATRAASTKAIDAFSAAYPPLYRSQEDDAGIVPITFWTNSQFGPTSRLRMIDAADWGEIERNYTADVKDELARLMSDFEPGKTGQLLLWQGPPGTGKTWALRALASEWRSWAEFNYITDPDAFFVKNPAYMIDVLLHDSYEMIEPSTGELVTDEQRDGKWRVLILEDTGELLSANAKEAYGQGLSRLLNVVDGMVGQGLRVLCLVTTNDELGDLHPAAVRPGRCASQVVFAPLSPEEASDWLGSDVGEPATLAELYSRTGVAAPAFDDAEQAVTAAAGDVAWGPEDGFRDLLDDVNEILEGGSLMEGGYRAIDAGVNLDKVLIRDYDGDCFYVAGITVDGAGEPVLADQDEWVTVESGWIEVDEEPEEGMTAATAAEVEATLPADHQPAEQVPRRRPSPPAPEAAAGRQVKWEATLCPEGVLTDDGRLFKEGSVSWRSLPLPLMAMIETQQGHDGAQVAGRIDRIWREGSLIRGAGVFDEGEFGQEIARLVADGTLSGISVDIAIRQREVGYRSDFDGSDEEPEEREGAPTLDDLLFAGDDLVFVVTDAVIGTATVCPFPAFAEATIGLAAAGDLWVYTHQAGFTVVSSGEAVPETTVLTASAAGLVPEKPPAEWFSPPNLTEATALTIDDDGRVYGHAAVWEIDGQPACHLGFPDACVTPPRSKADYAFFHEGEVVCEDGARVAVGQITLGTGHADRRLARPAAVEHYDHTGWAVADVRVGEDEHGIWVAGALRSTASEERVRELRGAKLSGDWRAVNGNLELVALLAVNVPGFPVPRPRALVAAGQQVLALVAAGIQRSPLSVKELNTIGTLTRVATLGLGETISALAARAREEAA